MLGNPLWFKRRKYGWGITPNGWQGWMYILCAFISIVVIYGLSVWLDLQPKYQVFLLITMVVLIVADALYMAVKINHSEREKEH